MKVRTFRSISIVTTMLLSLCFVINSYAASITYMSVYPPNDWGDGANVTVSLGTDADILYIRWSVNGTVERWTMHSKDTRTVTENFTLIGAIRGKKYEVEAAVWFWGEDDVSDTDSETFWVYKPKYTSEPEKPPKKHKNISGYAELSRQYYDGSDIVMSGYVYASSSQGSRSAYSRFRHTLTGRREIERDHPLTDEGELTTETVSPNSSYSHSDTLTHPNVDLIDDKRVDSGAYIRLVVVGQQGEDEYVIENTETFTSADAE